MILRKHKQNKRRLKFQSIIVCSSFIISAIIIITNDFGLIQLIKLKKQKNILQQEIQTLTKQQIKLNQEIVQLNTNTEYLEKLAREKFMMAKPGEKIFRVIEYKQIKQ